MSKRRMSNRIGDISELKVAFLPNNAEKSVIALTSQVFISP